jgi:thioredoxin reductase
MSSDLSYAAVVIGGGPAGLSAATVLARCRRRVIVIDDESPRNRWTRAVHGFLTRDGTPPGELRRLGREEALRYGVEFANTCALAVERAPRGFAVSTASARYEGRRLVIATGMRDRLPAWDGLDALLGSSVFQCPFCDGWEQSGRAWGAYAPSAHAAGYAWMLLGWTENLVLFTDGHTLPSTDRRELAGAGVAVRESPVVGIEREGPCLRAVRLTSGERVPREVLFVHAGQDQAASFAHELGCEITASGTVRVGKNEAAQVRGVYVVGDASMDLQCVAVAVAEGYKAAVGIHRELRAEAQRYARPGVTSCTG